MAKIKAVLPAMQQAASRISGEINEFMDVASKVLASAEELGNDWEGDSQVAFMEQQYAANDWYKQMTVLVNEYAAAIKNAANQYESTDEAAAECIKQ